MRKRIRKNKKIKIKRLFKNGEIYGDVGCRGENSGEVLFLLFLDGVFLLLFFF